DDMLWVFLVSDTGSATDAGAEHVATLNFDVGSASGIYSLGYVATVNTADMISYINADDVDDDLAGIDTSFNHSVEVVSPQTATLVINEISYNTPSYDHEWVEIYNAGTDAVDLIGIGVSDAGTHVPVTCDCGTTIEPGGYIVFCTDTMASDGVSPTLPEGFECDCSTGSEAWALSNGGDVVYLTTPSWDGDDSEPDASEYSDMVEYDDGGDWAHTSAADGDGPSLELI
ncbi:uncharacterized protein METZ01_LOCUS514700, partial [marine metagenome]